MPADRGRGTGQPKEAKVPGFGLNATLLATGAVERWLAPVLDRLPLPGASLWFALRKE